MLIRAIGVVVLLSVLSGCAQMAVVKESAEGRSPELLIASDLVNALMQAEGYHPATTRLQMQPPKHRFGKTLKKVFTSAGYDVQQVSSPVGNRFVDYSFSNRQNALRNAAQTYQLSVGEVKIKRDYQLSLGLVSPASDLFVSGVDASSIQMNDHIFSNDGDAAQPKVSPAKAPAPKTPATIEAPVQRDQEPDNATFQHVSASQTDSVTMDSTIELLVNGESTPSVYSAGDKLVFTVKTPVDTRLSCYYQEADAGVVRIFPNRFTLNTVVDAGSLLHIPSTDEWAIEATRSGGVDQVMCVSLDPIYDTRMGLYENTPDFEALPVSEFSQLVTEIKQVTGADPQIHHVSVQVN